MGPKRLLLDKKALHQAAQGRCRLQAASGLGVEPSKGVLQELLLHRKVIESAENILQFL